MINTPRLKIIHKYATTGDSAGRVWVIANYTEVASIAQELLDLRELLKVRLDAVKEDDTVEKPF